MGQDKNEPNHTSTE